MPLLPPRSFAREARAATTLAIALLGFACATDTRVTARDWTRSLPPAEAAILASRELTQWARDRLPDALATIRCAGTPLPDLVGEARLAAAELALKRANRCREGGRPDASLAFSAARRAMRWMATSPTQTPGSAEMTRARALYNHSVATIVRDFGEAAPGSRPVRGLGGRFRLETRLDPELSAFGPPLRLTLARDVAVTGLRDRHVRDGLGAALIGHFRKDGGWPQHPFHPTP